MRALRAQRKLTLVELAGRVRMDVSQLSKIERGVCGTSPEGYERIALALGVDVGRLFAGPRRSRAA